jgi:hypothetical protein
MSNSIGVDSADSLASRRSGSKQPVKGFGKPYRVVVHGLRHFCQKLPGLLGNESWDIRDRSRHTPLQLAALVRDLRDCDLVFTWAGRLDMGPFLWASRSLGTSKVVVFWCGSDVLRAKKLLEAGKMDDWIANRIHWAASPILAEEVRSMGVACEFVQASFVEGVRDPKPLPKEFSVMVFLPRADVAELYGWDRVLDVARALPNVKFRLVGLHKGQSVQAPPNVNLEYWTGDTAPLYEKSTVLWRPVRHDAGISFMVLEALSHGRHVLYTYPVPGAMQVSNPEEAKMQLEHLRALHEAGVLPLNRAGIEIVAQKYARDVVRKELHRRWEDIICS